MKAVRRFLKGAQTQRSICYFAAAVALSATGCSGVATSHAAAGVIPSSGTASHSRSSEDKSFAEKLGQATSDLDIESYIDPSVTGDDRKLAHHLMKIMPPDKRGDFVYIRKTGAVMSNRVALLSKVAIHYSSSVARGHNASALTRRTESLPGSGGPYARQYSVLGVDAALGYATIACNDNFLINPISGIRDKGFMYFGGFGNAGAGSGIDAGLQFNSDSNVQPFLSVSAEGGYQNFTYGSGTYYACGEAIGIMYGGLPAGEPQMYMLAGIPTYSPYTYNLPPSNAQWVSAEWTYFDKPSDFDVPGNDALGFPSPCSNCITKRMTSIGLTAASYSGNNECFGACNGRIAERWDQAVMGQLQEPCANTSDTTGQCTITFATGNQWLGGYEVYPDSSAVQVHAVTPNNAYEGINLQNTGVANFQRYPDAGTFSTGGPPPTPRPTVPPAGGQCGHIHCIGGGGGGG